MDDLRSLAGAYAIDALDDDERRAFESYMATHPEAAVEVDELRAAAGLLADDAVTTPPSSLRRAVLAAIRDLRQEPADETAVVVDLTQRGGRRPIIWLGAAAAVAVLVVAIAGGLAMVRGPAIQDVYTADDAVIVNLAGAESSAVFTFSRQLEAAVFLSDDLEPVGDDETYELWFITGDVAAPAGTFRPDAVGAVEVLVHGDLQSGSAVGLTVEPAGGSDVPTGDILLLETLP
ncbi:MAG TPA: anti-sigma factor [Acidimicrobiia bacterium]